MCGVLLKRAGVVLTSGVPADEEFSDFIVDKDEETVGERAQPPGRPEGGEEEEEEEEEGEEEQSQVKATGHIIIIIIIIIFVIE